MRLLVRISKFKQGEKKRGDGGYYHHKVTPKVTTIMQNVSFAVFYCISLYHSICNTHVHNINIFLLFAKPWKLANWPSGLTETHNFYFIWSICDSKTPLSDQNSWICNLKHLFTFFTGMSNTNTSNRNSKQTSLSNLWSFSMGMVEMLCTMQ